MNIMQKSGVAAVLAIACGTARASAFVNGGFEDGDIAGWTTGEGYRGNDYNATLTTAQFLPGGVLYTGPATSRSTVIAAGTVDPNLGALLGSTVYAGNYAYRAENTSNGGHASAISQKVTGYTESNIYFAWKAVLQNGGHIENESAEMLITLMDDTTHTLLMSRIYNAGDGGGWRRRAICTVRHGLLHA